MTKKQYKKKHFYLWNRIVKYISSKAKGYEEAIQFAKDIRDAWK